MAINMYKEQVYTFSQLLRILTSVWVQCTPKAGRHALPKCQPKTFFRAGAHPVPVMSFITSLGPFIICAYFISGKMSANLSLKNFEIRKGFEWHCFSVDSRSCLFFPRLMVLKFCCGISGFLMMNDRLRVWLSNFRRPEYWQFKSFETNSIFWFFNWIVTLTNIL